jgi:hypothetical protein
MPKIARISVLAIVMGVALTACQTGSAKEAQQQASNSMTCSASCGAGSYCRMDAPGQAGVCTPKPQACPMIYVAVCGTDGKTYPNECHAAQAGVNVAHQGACTK